MILARTAVVLPQASLLLKGGTWLGIRLPPCIASSIIVFAKVACSTTLFFGKAGWFLVYYGPGSLGLERRTLLLRQDMDTQNGLAGH